MDTADDIAVILNRALAEQHLGSLPPHRVRELIGRGIPTLIARAVDRLGGVTRYGRPGAPPGALLLPPRPALPARRMQCASESRTSPRCSADCTVSASSSRWLPTRSVASRSSSARAIGFERVDSRGRRRRFMCARKARSAAAALRLRCRACPPLPGFDGGRLADGRARGTRRGDAGGLRALWLQRGPEPRTRCRAMRSSIRWRICRGSPSAGAPCAALET